MKFLVLAFIFILANTRPILVTAQSDTVLIGAFNSQDMTMLLNDADLTSSLSNVLNGAILSGANIQSGTYNQATFYYVKAQALRNNKISSMAIMLTLSGSNLYFTSSTGCTMECSPNEPCSGCIQTITVPCVTQTCACSSASGGCTASTTFPNK